MSYHACSTRKFRKVCSCETSIMDCMSSWPCRPIYWRWWVSLLLLAPKFWGTGVFACLRRLPPYCSTWRVKKWGELSISTICLAWRLIPFKTIIRQTGSFVFPPGMWLTAASHLWPFEINSVCISIMYTVLSFIRNPHSAFVYRDTGQLWLRPRRILNAYSRTDFQAAVSRYSCWSVLFSALFSFLFLFLFFYFTDVSSAGEQCTRACVYTILPTEHASILLPFPVTLKYFRSS